jgi:hypothetical protein
MDFFTIAFSTFLGAAVALAAQRLTEAQNAKRQEEAALNNLVLDLAAKRAFVVAEDWDWADDEVRRVVGSVMHARDLVRETRLAARPRSRALPHLQQMTRACNTFLEWSERVDREQLKAPLRQLATEVDTEVASLHRLDPRHILDDRPGSLAL